MNGKMQSEREFKCNSQHWSVILNYLELHPKMVKSKFNNFDGDNTELKKQWIELVDQLNSLGYGKRSVEKWQLAIGRWKSKVKAKASSLKLEKKRTGGGEPQKAPLSALEERLMALLGWKTVTGDNNIGFGMTPQKNIEEAEASTSQTVPPLALSQPENMMQGGKKRKGDSEPSTKRKIPLSTKKSRKFVSMSHMHSENVDCMNKMNTQLKLLTDAVSDILDDFRQYMTVMMNATTRLEENSD